MIKSGTVWLCAAVVVCAGSVLGVSWRGGDGVWTDASMWDVNRPPVDGDSIAISAGGTYTVTMPTAICLKPASFRVSAGNGTSITLDGRGGSFTMPSATYDAYSNEPWGINGSKGHFFNLETYNITDSKKHAVVAMSNAMMRVTCQNDDVRLDVDEGFINFHDPEGTGCTHPFTTAAYAQRDTVIYVHENAHLRLPIVNFRCNATRTNLFCFAGGTHEIMGTLSMPSGNFTPGLASTGEFRATDGADIQIGGINFGGTVNGVTSAGRTFIVTVEKGATVAVGNNLSHNTASLAEVRVRDGGTLSVGGTLNMGIANNVTTRVEIVGATFNGHKVVQGAGGVANAMGEFLATNAIVNVTGNSFDVREGVARFVDSQTKLASCYPGYSGSRTNFGEMWFEGGTAEFGTLYCGLNSPGGLTLKRGATVTQKYGDCYVGKDAGTPGVLTIEDEGTSLELSPNSGGSGTVRVGNAGTGTVNVRGGTLAVPTGSMFIGYEVGSTGIVNQTGGRVVVSGSDALLVGRSGLGVYNMQGGELETYQIRFNWQGNSSTPTSVLHQTGGTIHVTNVDGSRGVNVCDSAGTHGRLVLDGGLLKCHRVRGWTGATAKGGGGWAVLEGNGGTIEATTTSTGFVETFDEALLGEKGLTLKADVSVTIPQDFANQSGAEGHLVLTGGGVKTLSGTDSRESALDVAGGKVLFADGASHASARVTVTNTATLSFAGASQGATFAAFTLGDGESLGMLEMELDDRIDVDTTPSFGPSFSLLIASASYAAGVYPLVTCPGDQTSSTAAEGWANGYVAEGRLTGLGYFFTASYDAVADRTSFCLDVRTGTALSGTSVWKGPGTAWATDANWADAKPGGNSIATFSAMGAPTTVQLDGNETVGALNFTTADAVTITGGEIAFADTGYAQIAATGGDVEIASDILLPSIIPFDVFDPAKVTISGTIARGGVKKSGTGRLYFEADDNAFRGNVVVEDGLLSAATFGSLGVAPGGLGTLTLAGGTLELRAGATGVSPRSLIVQTAADNAPAVLKNDGEVTFTSANVARGDLVKRGAGTLTFDCVTSVLSVDNGKCTQNETPSGTARFPTNGVVPSVGYSGFNVVDGEVVLRGGSYAIPNAISVGLETPDASDVDPAFTVDGAHVESGMSNYHFLLGANAITGRIRYTRPRLTVKNGGYLSVNTLNVAKGGNSPIAPEVLLDNGTLYGSWCINVCARGGVDCTYTVRNNSKLLSNTEVNWRGSANLTFTDSVFAKSTSLDPITILMESGVSGTWLTGANAEFRCSGLKQKSDNTVTFAFDGGRWVPAKTGGFDFCFAKSDRLVFETRGAGLKLAPPSGFEYRMAKAVTGTGGVTMDGVGTLRFVTQEIIQEDVVRKVMDAGVSAAVKSPYTLDFDGALEIASGRVVVEEGAARPGAVFTGVGTLVATNCPAPVFKIHVADDFTTERMLTLSDFSSTGAAKVDLGRMQETPLSRPYREITVARYEGAAPDVSQWKMTGGGIAQIRGVFKAVDGKITVSLQSSGCAVFIR